MPPAAKRRRDKPRGLASLTHRQQRVYDIICDHLRDHQGQSPTLREIADLMGFASLNGVMCHVRALVAKGVITRARHQARGIQVLIEKPIRAERVGDLVRLDCGDRIYNLDAAGAARLGEVLTRLAGRPGAFR